MRAMEWGRPLCLLRDMIVCYSPQNSYTLPQSSNIHSATESSSHDEPFSKGVG